MSIKLDWEVESEGGWAEIGEDAAALAARRRQAKRFRSILFALLGIGLLVGAVVGYRLYTADQQARSALRATVNAETTAIRIGDTSAYLDIQQNVGSWQQMQSDRFGQYQAETTRIKTDGNIVSLDMDGGKGRVVVEEKVDGKSYHVVWFYQYGEEGWKHVPPEIAYWGWSHDLVSPHYAISYWDEDEVFVNKLQEKLESWWDRACTLTDCRSGGATPPGLLKIRVEPDPLLQMGWASYDTKTLRVPSPLLGRVPADGSIDPAVERALAAYVAEHWDIQLLEAPPADYSDLAWAHDEFRQWLVASFIPGAPPAPVMSPLAETSGPAAVRALVDRVKQGQDVVAALQDVTGKPVDELPVLWDRYLTYRLRGEAALIDADHPTEAILLYRDPERLQELSPVIAVSGLRDGAAGTITVHSTRHIGDLLWAEVHFLWARPAVSIDAVEVSGGVTYEPFRLVGGRWVHTTAFNEEYGSLNSEQGDHITLYYNAIDSLSVDGILPALEQQYMTIAADLAISNPPPMEVGLSPSLMTSVDPVLVPPVGFQGDDTDKIAIWVASPYTSVFPDSQPQHVVLVNVLTQGIVDNMVAWQARPLTGNNALVRALARWEVRKLGLDASGMMGAPVRPGAVPPESLNALWTDSLGLSTNGEKAAAADVLLEMIIEKQGAQVIPTLLQNLSTATSMEDWLSRSVGLRAADLEPEWKLRLRAVLPPPLPQP